jgi:hypothetical protein
MENSLAHTAARWPCGFFLRTKSNPPSPENRLGNDGSGIMHESRPVGQFFDITIGDWRGYDLVAAG